ncbi:MAG: hypothetical protein WC856_16635 [Methylococcaceae bacterium]|jgi:hypothetical protein
MQQYPKNIKRLLREYMVEAYERELHRELAKLAQSFAEWRDGKISSVELSSQVHQYETGPSRELYKKYNDSYHDANVAYAIAASILKRDEIPVELLEAISSLLGFSQSLKEDGE